MTSEESTNTLQVRIKKSRFNINPIRVFRRIIQIIFLVSLNAGIIGLLSQSGILTPWMENPLISVLVGIVSFLGNIMESYFFVLPILQTYSNPATVSTGLFSLLQSHIIAGFIPFLEIGILLLIVVFVGRGFCGWVCPFGTIQDAVAKVPTKKWNISPSTNEDLSEIKYYLLVIILAICTWIGISTVLGTAEGLRNALGALADGPFDAISPAATIDSLIPWMIIEGTLPSFFSIIEWVTLPIFFWIRVGFLLFVLVLSMFIPRAFCRYLCPMGALAGIFSKFSFLGFKRKPHLCDKLRICEDECPMGIRILQENWERIRSRECINCGRCQTVCPTHAIKPAIN